MADQKLSEDARLAAIIRGMVALTEIGWAPDLRFDDDGHWKIEADTFCELPWHDSPQEAWAYFVRVRLAGEDEALAALTARGAGHINTEAEWIAQSEHLNCPTCGGSGHADDATPAVQDERDARLEAFEALLDAQDALDNREYQGINAESYEVLMRRRNAARRDLDALPTMHPSAGGGA